MNGSHKFLVGAFFVISSTADACKCVLQASKGFVAGAAATVLVDMGKQYATDLMKKNNIDLMKLNAKYNLDNPQITSDVTNTVAILGVSAVDRLWCGKKGVGLVSLTARLVGIFGGSATARYMTTLQNQATPVIPTVTPAS